MKKRALVVLTDGFEDIEAIAAIDVLNRVGIEVVVASLESSPVHAAYGTTIVPDTVFTEVEGEFDAVICPGGKKNAQMLGQSPALRKLIQDFNRKGKLVAAICAAPSHVLGESAGILKGKRATGDPGFNEKLADSGATVTDQPITVEGNIITASGPGSALQFALTIAAYLAGEDAVKPFSQKWGIELVPLVGSVEK